MTQDAGRVDDSPVPGAAVPGAAAGLPQPGGLPSGRPTDAVEDDDLTAALLPTAIVPVVDDDDQTLHLPPPGQRAPRIRGIGGDTPEAPISPPAIGVTPDPLPQSHPPESDPTVGYALFEPPADPPDDTVARLRQSGVEEQERAASRPQVPAAPPPAPAPPARELEAPPSPADAGRGAKPLIITVAVVVIVGIMAMAGIALVAPAVNPSSSATTGSPPGLLATRPGQLSGGAPVTTTLPAVVETAPIARAEATTPTSAPPVAVDATQPGPTWAATRGWSINESLLENDGSSFGDANWRGGLWNVGWIAAPSALQTDLADYAVDAEILVQRRPACGSFGLVIRGAYQVGVHDCQSGATPFVAIRSSTPTLLDNAFLAPGFDPASGWHVYRVEIYGDQLRVSIDGVPVANVSGLTVAQDGPVGVWDDHTELSLRAIRVTPLSPA
jgi:hypothetical protein